MNILKFLASRSGASAVSFPFTTNFISHDLFLPGTRMLFVSNCSELSMRLIIYELRLVESFAVT